MYINSNGNNVHQFMNGVHNRMKAQYLKKRTVSADSAQALQLQHFFQDLKSVASGGTSSFFDEEILKVILDSIQDQGTIMGSNFLVKNLFSKRGGSRFERELASIYEAVWNEIGEEEFDVDQVLIGSSRGNINFSGIDDLAQEIVESFGTKTYRVIQDEVNNTKLKQYYMPEVDGKIDIKGYNIKIRGNANAEMVKIYNLLKDATFSAKNYDSMSFDQKTKEFVMLSGHQSLILGKSNIFRALYGTLSDLGYAEKTILKAIFAGFNSIKKGNDDIAQHFYHLRYIYELMGTGIQYAGNSYGNVKFIIYNDPHGGIYVRSTLDIIQDLMNELFEGTGKFKWDSQISLSKVKFE